MKKSMKAKRPAADPVVPTAGLNVKPELSKPSAHLPERGKNTGHRTQKIGR